MAPSAIVVTLTLSDRHARITSRWDRIPWFCCSYGVNLRRDSSSPEIT
jgi:hypothetical protein